MRKLFSILPVLLLLFGTVSFAENDMGYFPLDTGRIWVYDDGNLDQIVTFLKEGNSNSSMYLFVFEPYGPYVFGKRMFYRDGLKIYEHRNRYRRLWYDFGAKPGETWKMVWSPFGSSSGNSGDNPNGNPDTPPEEIADINDGAEVTLVASDEVISVPYGDFKNVFHFKILRPRVNDAAYVEEWFAPGIGCIQRVWDTIAGPHMQKLSKLIMPGSLSPLRLDVTLDKENYATEEDIQITVSLLNWSDREITIEFPTPLQVDYYIDNAYQWSEGRIFTEVATSVTIPARDVYKWTFTHTAQDYRIPSGKHFITAVVVGHELKAGQPLIVNQEFPSLPSGIELSLKTSKDYYTQGEPIPFTFTASNTTNEEITLNLAFLGEIPVKYWIDNQPEPVSVEPGPSTKEITVSPGESLTYEVIYTADEGILEPGGHGLFARLNGYDNIVYTKFIITRELTLGTVTGTVITYDETGEKIPVAGAVVNLSTVIPKNYDSELSNIPRAENMNFTATTDDAGTFAFADIPVGVFYTLIVKKEGFYPYIETIRTLQDATELLVVLKPTSTLLDDYLNVKRHKIAGLIITMGTDRTVCTPDSPFKALFGITNTLNTEVRFSFDSENYVDWYLDTPEGIVPLTEDTIAKSGTFAEFTITLTPGETRTFTRTSTFKGRAPEEGGKYTVRASLRYTLCSIADLKSGDVSDYVNILVVPNGSECVNANGYNREMVLDLKSSASAYININTKDDDVSGNIAVTEILSNFHAPKLRAQFIKMLEIEADSTIRADMDSALVRIYYDPADFSGNFDPRFLLISHWDDNLDNPDWQDLMTRVDTINNFVEAWTTGFSSFGLFYAEKETGVHETDEPLSFRLYQNTPNPFNPATTIRFSTPNPGLVKLTVFNIAGQEVARLVDGALAAGEHRVVFDGNRYASGIYFYRLTGAGFSESRKMLLIR